MEETTTKKNNTTAILIVVGLLLAGSGAYIYNQYTALKFSENRNQTLQIEKDDALQKLKTLDATYQNALANNTSISAELEIEKEKVNQLMEEIKNTKPDANQLALLKRKIAYFEDRMKELMLQVSSLKQENAILTMQRDSTLFAMKQLKGNASPEKVNTGTASKVLKSNANSKTLASNVNLSEKDKKIADKLSKINIIDLEATAFKNKSSNEEPEETQSAKNLDFVKISFVIPQNFVVRASERNYYIQVLDSKGVFVGEKGNVTFNENEKLTYSFKTSIKYKNKALKVVENLYCKNFKKGMYFVNVYDNFDLVDKTTFTLK